MQTVIASSKSLFEDFVINPGEKLYMGNNTYHPYPLNIGSLDIVPSFFFFWCHYVVSIPLLVLKRFNVRYGKGIQKAQSSHGLGTVVEDPDIFVFNDEYNKFHW